MGLCFPVGSSQLSMILGQRSRVQFQSCAAYGWDDPIALVNDFETDLQQALRNHEQAGRAGAIKIFAEEVNWTYLIKTSDTHIGTHPWQNPPLVRTW